MYESNVNEQYKLMVDPNNLNWDLLEIKDGKFHILQDNQSFDATILETNYETKTFSIKINRNTYEVNLKDKFDLLVEKLGFSNMTTQKVLDVLVQVGDSLAKGDSVLILEAMKMENVIKAEGDAIVKSIEITKGTPVEKNQILVEFE